MKMIGIDPGLDGAYALLEQVNNEPVQLIEAHFMPTFMHGKKEVINVGFLSVELDKYKSEGFEYCYVEHQTLWSHEHRTKKSEESKLNNYWLLLQILDSIGIEKTEITINQWTAFRNRMIKSLATGSLSSKEKSRVVCMKLWGEPHCMKILKMKQANKLHDGKSDAALIGVYGLHHVTRSRNES